MIYAIILKMLKASYADMAKLADALASGANRGNSVQVQVLLSAFFIMFQTGSTDKNTNGSSITFSDSDYRYFYI